MKTLILLLSILSLSACVLPGSRMAHLEFEGQVFDANKKPMANQELSYALPPHHGYSSMEKEMLRLGDKKWDIHDIQADKQGQFSDKMSYVQHVSCWLIPFFSGCGPKPPPPMFALKLKGQCSKEYLVGFEKGQLKYLIRNPETKKNEAPEPNASEITGSAEPLEFGWKTRLTISPVPKPNCETVTKK